MKLVGDLMLKNFLSIDELKYSALVFCLILGFGFGLYSAIKFGDIGDNFTNLLITLIVTIGGVNSFNLYSKYRYDKNDNKTNHNYENNSNSNSNSNFINNQNIQQQQQNNKETI